MEKTAIFPLTDTNIGVLLDDITQSVMKNNGQAEDLAYILGNPDHYLYKRIVQSVGAQIAGAGINSRTLDQGILKNTGIIIQTEERQHFKLNDFFLGKDELFSHVGSDFFARFPKTIEKVESIQLTPFVMPSDMTDQEVKENAEEYFIEVTPGHIAEIIRIHEAGEKCLLDNGDVNVFYLLDEDNILRGCTVRWNERGWDVRPYKWEPGAKWHSGYRVFLRSKVLQS